MDAAVGVDVPGLNPRDMDIKSRVCRLLANRFPDVISFDRSTTFQNMVLRLEPSSAASFTPALFRATPMDPLRPVASLTSLRRRLSGLVDGLYHFHLLPRLPCPRLFVVDCCDCRRGVFVFDYCDRRRSVFFVDRCDGEASSSKVSFPTSLVRRSTALILRWIPV